MAGHGGSHLWPSELYTFFTLIKKVFLSLYGRLIRIKIFGNEFWREFRRSCCIVVANHVTGVDSIVLQIALKRRLFLLAARKWFVGRFIQFFMTFFCDMVPVALEEGTCNILGIKRALALLKRKQSVAVYPAGDMYRDASVPKIHSGAAYLSFKSGTPILPVYIKNLALGPARPGLHPLGDDTREGLGSVLHNIFNRNIEIYIAPPIYPGIKVNRKKEIYRLNAEIRRAFEELQQQATQN